MSNEQPLNPGQEDIDRLVDAFNQDVDLETRKQQLDLQRAELSVQLRQARAAGDSQRCDEILRRKAALLEARQKLQ